MLGKAESLNTWKKHRKVRRVLDEKYIFFVKQYSRSREICTDLYIFVQICNTFGYNFTCDQAFFNFFESALFTTVSDR